MDGAFYVLREEVTTHDLHLRSQHDIVVRYDYTVIFGFRGCKRNDGYRQKSREEFSAPRGIFLFPTQATSPVYCFMLIRNRMLIE